MMQLLLLSSMYCSPIAHGRLKVTVVFWSHDKLAWRRGEGGGENNGPQRNSGRFKMAASCYVFLLRISFN